MTYRHLVPDTKPPRVSSDDRATLTTLLQFQRDSVVHKVEGLGDAQAAWSPVGSGTSLVWLVGHLGRAERSWVLERFAGGPTEANPGAPATLAAAVDDYRATWARVDAVVAASSLDQACAADVQQPPVNLRWVLAHLLEETARHAGHADILRELLDGATGR